MKKIKLNKQLETRESIVGWLFSSPYVVASVFLFLIPLFWALWLSTTDWNLITSDIKSVGLGNFITALKSDEVKEAFTNSFKYIGCIVFFSVTFGILLALLIRKVPKKLKGLVSVLFFIPYLTSGVATAVLMKYFCAYSSPINTWMREVLNLNISWFSDDKAAFFLIIVIIVWKLSGYYALFFVSAIENIPEEVHEAAALDGCTGLRKFWYIILPMIIPTIITVVTLASGLSLRVYTEPFLLTGGSVGTTTWMVEIFFASFSRFKSGYGAAMSIIFAIQTFVTLRVINFIMNKLNDKFGC